jgi:iron complex outermembrane receptor protein
MQNFKLFFIAFSLFSSFALNLSLAQEAKNQLSTITVTANPFLKEKSELTQPITVLEGDELLYKMQPTIGDSLASEVGIRSSYYGPAASRPVIRGLDGDQILILQNGINNIDASAASADHNLAIDPLSVEKIEVVRGPAALLYGSRAVGGVVNIVDNRIPSEKIAEKLTGKIDFRYNSANSETSNSALFEGGAGDYAWHFNNFKRITDDIKIAGHARSARLRAQEPLEEGENEQIGEVANSDSRSEGRTIGFSKFFDKGYFGLAFTNYKTRYGVVGHEHHHEEDHHDDEHHDDEDEEHHDEDEHHDEEHAHGDENVFIDMRQSRLDLAGAYMDTGNYIKEIKYKIGFSNYEHKEIEGAQVATTFRNKGYDSRFELIHEKIANMQGNLGLQFASQEFDVLGSEAFMPKTTTNNGGAFIFEEFDFNKLNLQIGARFDSQEITVDRNNNFAQVENRSDFTGSSSFGVNYKFSKEYLISFATSYTQRAPNAQELYANGEHIATRVFEVGNQNLDVQKSVAFDLSLRKKSDFLNAEVNLFYNHFQNFITQTPSGQNDAESGLPIYNYVNLPARFYGAELKAAVLAYDKNAHKLNFEISGDYLIAENRNTGENLPRIAPPRVGVSAIYQYQKFKARIDNSYNFAQNKTAQNELKTDDFMMVDFGVDYNCDFNFVDTIFYAKLTNLLDEEARNHVSFLKDRIPLMGRSLMLGVRGQF